MGLGLIKVLRVRVKVRKELRLLGYQDDLINDAIQVIDEDEIRFAAERAGPEAVKAFSDGTVHAAGPFLDWLGEFFKSPEGKLLIDILVKLIVALLMGLVGS